MCLIRFIAQAEWARLSPWKINPLALVRRDRFELGQELAMRRRIDRSMFHLRASRIVPEEVVAVPIRRRSDWPLDEPTAAVGTDITQNLLNARHTEGALIRADPRLKRLRRQSLVAVLAGRSEFKHGVLDVKLPKTGNQWFLEHFPAPLE